MTIRPGTENDIPEIIELLKLSLGETLMPKSEKFWRWKHVENPFGNSPVLLAFDGELLVGVRAFMRWDWLLSNRVIHSVRAVDTATHPDYQGKGIFRKLTLTLVDINRENGIEFIYNTPNKISKAGYLKMGWVSLGRYSVGLKAVFGLKENKSYHLDYKFAVNKHIIEDFFKIHHGSVLNNSLVTNYDANSVYWRYGTNPNVDYYMITDDSCSYILFFRMKRHLFGLEFRICDVFFSKKVRLSVKHLNNHVVTVAKMTGAIMVSGSASLMHLLRGSVLFRAGPEVTRLNFGMTHPPTLDHWNLSIGDLEVF